MFLLKKNLNNFRKAFSLIELSIVILIVGILVAGVTQSSRLVKRMRLTTAQQITSSSDVNSISDMILWLEATLIAGPQLILDKIKDYGELIMADGIAKLCFILHMDLGMA